MKHFDRISPTAAAATVAIAAMSCVSQLAQAATDFSGDFISLPAPEPETLALLAIGAVALIVARLTGRK